uniref:protein-tyrosine-phosphatase n=1 Tax=Phallusia mammillata TaxID=59560 RepID=A0A6F9DQN0_9ASCI|nr:receptor-type tyrosine-protein phosphatase epsilon [Phallusia mammillata]
MSAWGDHQNLLGKWLDFPCSLKLKFYICQKELIVKDFTDVVAEKFTQVFFSGKAWFVGTIQATVLHANKNTSKNNLANSLGTHKNFNYSIAVQSINDAGNYLLALSGKLSSSSSSVTKSVQFIVYVPANISLTSSNITVGKNRSNAFIDCVSFGYNIPSALWYKGATSLPQVSSSPVFQSVTTSGYSVVSRLSFSNATRADSGMYVCKAINYVGSKATAERNTEAEAHVFVEYAPIFNSSVPQNRENVPFAKQLNLSCTFHGAPLPTIYWRVNGINVVAGDPGLPIYTLMNYQGYRTTSTIVIYNSVILGPKANLSCHSKNVYGTTDPIYFTLDLDYFDARYYWFAPVKKKFTNARSVCQKYDGDLAIITDNKTQQFIQNKGAFYANRSEWMKITKSAFVGAERRNGTLVWFNDTPLDQTFTQWSKGQPKKHPCVVLSNKDSDNPRFSWRTGHCTNKRYFVCQFKAQPVTFLPSQPVSCSANQLSVRWKDMTVFTGKITFNLLAIANVLGGIQTVYNKTETINSTDNHEYQILLGNLKTQDYRIQVVLFPQIWNLPVPMETVLSTRIAVADKAKNFSATLNMQTCVITWTWPTNINMIEITGYKLNITKKLSLFASNSSSLATWQEQQIFNVSMKNVTDLNHSHNVSMLPNQMLSITLQVMTCSSDGVPVFAHRNCATSPKEPDFVPSMKRSNSALSVIVSPVNEINGPVSCYFVVGMDAESTNNSLQQILTWTELPSVLLGNIPYWHCAFAIPRFTGDPVTKIIGDKSVSTCDVKTDFNSNLMETHTCKNPTLTQNKLYKFMVITTTAVESSVAVKASPFVEISANIMSPSTPIGLIVGISIGVFLLTLIIIVALIFLRRRKSSKKTNNIIALDNRNQDRSDELQPNETLYENVSSDIGRPIALSKLLDRYNTYSRDAVTYNTQFKELKEAQDRMSLDKSVATDTRNKERNRYKNILPYDFNRVKLKGGNPENNDYINASYINGYNGNVKFIAAQGPRPVTVQHFWQMIWEQNCKTIVMLTNVLEKTKQKCEKYWPEPNENLRFGKYAVKTDQEESYGSYIVRSISITRSDLSECRYVTHYHFAAWPDHGVPVCTTGLLRFHRVIKQSQSEDGSPILVHCSAGVGRTGTYIGLDILEQQMIAEGRVDVFSTVLNMRRQRMDMVQNINQYILMHKLIVEIHTTGDTDLPCDIFAEHCSRQQTLKKEFEWLNLIPPLETSQSRACQHANRQSCRDDTVLPYNRSLVTLSGNAASLYENVFINASFVQDYEGANSMIVTQGPMSSNINQFWQMVCDHNAAAIVMLTSVDNDQSFGYWTENLNSRLQLNYINVTMTAKTDLGQDITRREFYVEEVEGSVSVTHLQCDVNKRGDESTVVERFLELVSQAHSLRQENRPIVVHCRDGAGRSGVFCALFNLLDRTRIENRIDVFRTVKDLRDARPFMVRSLADYLLLYKTAQTHVSARSIYANV